jgi:hypothetical protein
MTPLTAGPVLAEYMRGPQCGQDAGPDLCMYLGWNEDRASMQRQASYNARKRIMTAHPDAFV